MKYSTFFVFAIFSFLSWGQSFFIDAGYGVTDARYEDYLHWEGYPSVVLDELTYDTKCSYLPVSYGYTQNILNREHWELNIGNVFYYYQTYFTTKERGTYDPGQITEMHVTSNAQVMDKYFMIGLFPELIYKPGSFRIHMGIRGDLTACHDHSEDGGWFYGSDVHEHYDHNYREYFYFNYIQYNWFALIGMSYRFKTGTSIQATANLSIGNPYFTIGLRQDLWNYINKRNQESKN